MDQTAVARHINKTVVSQACEFAWGIDASQVSLVRKYIATVPEHILVTAEQAQEALAVARGELQRD
jgi:hypothetical protein